MSRAAIFKSVLDILYYSGTAFALRRSFRGIGAIFMLHHVVPEQTQPGEFAPNRLLEISPDFLDQVITRLKARGFDLVNLDEAASRIRNGGRPFAVFTLDDGYRDNLIHARPVFRRHECPYTVYVAPAITDGTCELWWRVLEQVIADNHDIKADLGAGPFRLACRTPAQKNAAWKRLYWPVRLLEQHEQRRWTRQFAADHGFDLERLCRDAAMDWNEVRTIAADPLCTIGAHTVNHFNVKALDEDEALAEMVDSAARIEAETGTRPRLFAYPYGDRGSAGPRDFTLATKAGFVTAVTTRKGMIFPEHGGHMTALPRFSISGEYQNLRYFETLLTGLPFMLLNRMRLLNVG
jgi:peptidoglycan/xylan/chitin deacetylase (PgdA/CDA1 family)